MAPTCGLRPNRCVLTNDRVGTEAITTNETGDRRHILALVCGRLGSSAHDRTGTCQPRFPSSKTRSESGHIHAGLRLQKSRWTYPDCDSDHHRDQNAAINTEREGLGLLASVVDDTTSAPDVGWTWLAQTDAQAETANAAGNKRPVGGMSPTLRFGGSETPNMWFGSATDAPAAGAKGGQTWGSQPKTRYEMRGVARANPCSRCFFFPKFDRQTSAWSPQLTQGNLDSA